MSRSVISVSRVIPAPAADLFAVVADPSRHAEIDGSGSVVGARSAASRRLELGDTFGMDMKMGLSYSTRNVVIELVPDRRIAWQTLAAAPLDKVVTGRIWAYDFEPVDGGTLVTETWDTRREAPLSRPLIRRFMAEGTERSMRQTLERLERVVTG